MFLRKNILREKIVIMEISKCLCEKYNSEIVLATQLNRSAILFDNKKFGLAFTMCTTNKGRCIKIEDLLIEKKYRNNKLGTNIMQDLMKIAKENNMPLGLWCEKENKNAQRFYERLGFKHTDTMNDYWYEYNSQL